MTQTESQTLKYKGFKIVTSFSIEWGWEYVVTNPFDLFYEEGCQFNDEAEALKAAMAVVDSSDYAMEREAEREQWK